MGMLRAHVLVESRRFVMDVCPRPRAGPWEARDAPGPSALSVCAARKKRDSRPRPVWTRCTKERGF